MHNFDDYPNNDLQTVELEQKGKGGTVGSFIF